MDKVLTRQLVRHALAVGVLTLVHCGHIGNDVADSIAKANGKGFGNAVNCAVSQDLTTFTAAVSVDLEQSELDQLFTFIANNKVTTAAEFWAWQNPTAANDLKDKLAAAYVALPNESLLRQETVDFYNEIFALDLIAAQAKKNANMYRYTRGVQAKDGSVTLHTVEVSVQHPTVTGRQVFADCQ